MTNWYKYNPFIIEFMVILIYIPYAACAIKICGGEMRGYDIIFCQWLFSLELLKEKIIHIKYKIIYIRYELVEYNINKISGII